MGRRKRVKTKVAYNPRTKRWVKIKITKKGARIIHVYKRKPKRR